MLGRPGRSVTRGVLLFFACPPGGPLRRCPLWVISGHGGKSARCLLYPQKRTFGDTPSMSAKCQYLAGTGKSRCLRGALRRLNYSTPSSPRVCWHSCSQWLLNLLSLTCKSSVAAESSASSKQGDGRHRHSVTMLAAGHLESLPQCGDAIFQAPRPESRIFLPVSHLSGCDQT